MSNYYMILTSVGIAKLINATLTSVPLDITHMAVGDSGGSHYSPTQSATALKNEVWRGTVHLVEQSTDNPNWIVVEAVIPTTVGGFTARELGLIDAEGDLIAIGKIPETYKPIMEEGSAKDLYLKAIIEASNASSVVMKVDPSSVIANRKYVDDKIQIVSTNLISLETRLTEHLDQYATTQDLSITVTSGQSLHQVLNALPMRIDHIVTVNVASGTYDEDVYFEGRVGKGRILINGDTAVSSTRKVKRLLSINNTIQVTVTGLDFTTVTGAGLYAENCTDVIIDKCKCVQSSATQNAITFVFSKGTVQGSEFSNRAMAIYAGNSSIVSSSGNTGTGNQLGLVAEFTSTIGKAGIQPSGTTAELVTNGGEIR